MTRIPGLTGAVVRSPRRPRLALAVTALAALSLTACGTEKTSAAGSHDKPADTQHTRTATGSDHLAAFTPMLNKVARSCPSDAPPKETLPTDDPATDALEAPRAPTRAAELELGTADWCASTLHEERITQALRDLDDPTPAQVRKTLNDLGYIDERIHGLRQSGATTRFFLDLRVNGGRLCMDGSAAGEHTIVDACVASGTGPFTPGKRTE